MQIMIEVKDEEEAKKITQHVIDRQIPCSIALQQGNKNTTEQVNLLIFHGNFNDIDQIHLIIKSLVTTGLLTNEI